MGRARTDAGCQRRAPRHRRREQLAFSLDAEGEQSSITENVLVNEIRKQVDQWRDLPPSQWGVTPETQRLLLHWRRNDRERKLFFCQCEAVETLIYLTEVDPKRFRRQLADANAEANPELFRIACKMATGSRVETQLLRRWDREELLRPLVTGETIFPLRLVFEGPSSSDLSERFEAVRAWMAELLAAPHIRIEWRDARHRVQGRQNCQPAGAAQLFSGPAKDIPRLSDNCLWWKVCSVSPARGPRPRARASSKNPLPGRPPDPRPTTRAAMNGRPACMSSRIVASSAPVTLRIEPGAYIPRPRASLP